MSIPMPKRAFILAGGAGKRLRPYTENTPKPLLQIGPESLLERTLLNAQEAGITEVFISLYYRIQQFQDQIDRLRPKLSRQFDVTIIEEEEVLGTGGAIVNALPYLSHEPFFILQTNILWDEKQDPALEKMAAYFEPSKMDALVLMYPTDKAPYYEGRGNYIYDPATGQAHFNDDQHVAPYVTCGIRLVHPRLFKDATDGAFPLSTLMAQAQQAKRFYGLPYEGDWWAIDTKAQFLAAQRHFQNNKADGQTT